MSRSLYSLSYRIFGRFAILIESYFEDLRKDLKSSGLKISLSKYISIMLWMSSIAFLLSFLIPLIFLMVRMPIFYALVGSLGLGILSAGITFWIMYILPKIIAMDRKSKMERTLAFVTNYMAILSSANVIPERIFKSLSMANIDPVVREEFADIVRRIELTGEDFLLAVKNKSEETPSKQFSELLKGILIVSKTGGDLKRFLRLQARYFIRLRRISLKKALDQLGIIAEIFVTTCIVMPLIMIIMLSVISLLGQVSNFILWIYLITLLLVPLSSIVIIILVDTIMPKEE
ncbi:MAG: type II secretion system F family protein [Candidatus Methanomethyliaceae archaeon]|nr:type II secretion system F family protein [Candidatus Methanomethyliaceae archaeon]MDW7971204.1 type II secretion system F family protein [Nitrososphaerota archaeon]